MLQGEPARPASQWPVVVRPPGSLIVAIGSLAVRAFGLTKAANYAISLAAAAMEMAMVDLADAMMGTEPGPSSRDKCDENAHARIQRRPQRRVPSGWTDDGLRSVNLELPDDQRL